MDALAAADVIAVWEAGRGRHPVDRALTLLAVTTPDATRDELATLPVGRRDAQLLRLRQAAFGDRIEVLSECPGCAAQTEIELGCDELLASEPAADVSGEHTLEADGYVLTYRLPHSFDLAAIASMTDVGAARSRLLERCVRVAGAPEGEAAEVSRLPDAAVTAVSEAMAALDPQAELLLDLVCPECGHAWQSQLDIVTVLWAEMSAQARRLLMEVDQLARAYGWTEDEILRLSAARRATYLELVAG